ncbi:hypothetical protein [Vibrio parahaemolyticus]|uniref:hypothetical protein n=1 Tax=Vibrio parahaemolyticus TaxID=670 RepID=UPI0015DE13E3|nr:hypothetical protein [Vibrio parahaemolyticus]
MKTMMTTRSHHFIKPSHNRNLSQKNQEDKTKRQEENRNPHHLIGIIFKKD